jgi:Zn-dependent oligopeptidase
MPQNNPLLSSYDLPPFSAIRLEHLVPAVERIIADSQLAIAEIIASQTPFPTWDDLVLAMDAVKARLEGTLDVIDILGSVNPQQAWTDAATRCVELATGFKAQLWRNNELFQLYQRLADSRIAALFDRPRRRVLDKILEEFRLAGIHLPHALQQRLAELTVGINRLEREFLLRMQQAGEAWSKHIEDESLLAGLPGTVKRSMANKAQKESQPGWLISLDDEQYRQVMLHAEHRPLRQEMWIVYHSRATGQGPFSAQLGNDQVLEALLDARHVKARLLGYENFAELAVGQQMAESTDQVLELIHNMVDGFRETFASEAHALKGLALQQGITEPRPWDYEYLAEKIRQRQGASQQAFREYFSLDRVLSRLCELTQRLFGVELLERSDFDTWHEDVRLFELREHAQTIGYLYVDPYRRELTGAVGEMRSLRERRVTAEGRPRLPIAVLYSKLVPGEGDIPCLLDVQQLETLSHEWGHCLQLLLTGAQYRDISGLDGLAPDRLEFAGEALEEWGLSPEFLMWVSSHYRTGEPIAAEQLDRLLEAAGTQNSWAAANYLLLVLFDFEVHRTRGDGRGAQEVFDASNTEIGHLKWPEGARPYCSWITLALPYAAGVYAYSWAAELAGAVFQRFVGNGIFDPRTGRAFREAFFTHGDVRPLQESVDLFLQDETADSITPPDADEPAQADSATDPGVSLINRLALSQRRMIRLNDAAPTPSAIARQYLDDWFASTFPALAASVSVEELSVRPPREEATGLGILFWRAVAGHALDRIFNMGDIDIVHVRGGIVTHPGTLNSPEAKGAIERMLDAARASYQAQLEQALNDFWDNPAEFSAGRNVIDWLADELGGQLMTQADLHLLDATLSPQLHKTVTDYALSAPSAASREELPERIRPGVYAVQYAPPDWGGSLPVRDAAVVTEPGNHADFSAAALWRPGEPLEAIDSLTALKTHLQQNGDVQGEVSLVPLSENFLVHQAKAIREAQKEAVLEELHYGSQEAMDKWVQHLDEAADIGERLDLTWTMDAYQLRSARKKLDGWLHRHRYVTGADRLAWWAATREWKETVATMPLAPPDPVALATPAAIADWTRNELARLMREKNLAADPDQVFLSIQKQVMDPRAPKGASAYDSGVVLQSVLRTFDDRRSIVEWAMSNLTPDERNALYHREEGPLSFAQIKDIIESADVGARLPVALRLQAQARRTEWMSLKGKQLRAEIWAAHISGDLTHDRQNTGLNLVLAAVDSPKPEGRRTVDGHETVVRQLQWGDSVLNDVLAFGVKTLASRPSLTLYTPQAPDGKVFREVHGGGSRDLTQAVASALTRTPEMTHWLISRLPLAEQASQIASMTPAAPDLTTEQKIKQVTQSIFYSTRFRAVASFSSGASFPVVSADMLETLYETQIDHALKTVDALTLSNAERDSAAAQEGRRNGITLLTGAMSMFPTSRLGGMLGRMILPVMAGGAAVSAISEENGSFSQWMSDFISGLGDVLAEGGQDLIMGYAGRRQRKTRPLSTLPPMPLPELKPLRLKGFGHKGLKAEGRGLYRDAGGQGYLKAGEDYYKTAVQGGERIVYAPGNRADQRSVKWENGQWQAKERHRLRGGGPLMSLLRTQDTPHDALVEGALAAHPNPTAAMLKDRRDTAYSMPAELTQRILKESMDDVGVSDIAAYRSLVRDLNQGSIPVAPHKHALQALRDKLAVWKETDTFARHVEQNVFRIELSTLQKTRIFDTVLRFRKGLDPVLGAFKTTFTVISDRLTGAKFIVIAAGRITRSLEGILTRLSTRNKTAEEKARGDVRAKFHGDIAAADKYIDTPEGANEYSKLVCDHIRNEMKASNTPGVLTEIRSNGLPYLIYTKGKVQKKTVLLNAEEVHSFETSLKHYAAPEVEIVTKTPSKKIISQPATTTEAPVETKAPVATDKFAVNISPLAETQMSYDSFPEGARTKISQIMADIRAGRTTTKRINQYYWYDMAQLVPGSGRGVWRAAFERKGETWELGGFYNYHANRQATVWGD